jgi:superfamily II DNA or RNA helicase
MFHQIIQRQKNNWLKSSDCPIAEIVAYIKQKGELRTPQIEAIETYLFLKIKAENKPLWQLFIEGFFIENVALDKLNINQETREFLSHNKPAFALYCFSSTKENGKSILPELEQLILDKKEQLDYIKIAKDIFYQVHYADYLLSLPMGAGKTFLMASFIYLDLYFANNELNNKTFAHNFLVLIPSGLKSSIFPSLKTIENFDPSWVIPEPSATNLKRLLKFDILDEQKTGKKSNKARNPNAQKVNACLPNPFGQVFVVNAEKVILDSFKFTNQTELSLEDEEKDTNNDLKKLFGQIPNLSILIDEVHHAQTDDIKLRKVVNYWQEKGNITTVLGFSGTPYLEKAEKIPAGNLEFKFSQITNTVYFYPLIDAVKNFLKKPIVKIGDRLERLEIIKRGIEDFNTHFADKKYSNGAIPKIAIYCSSIEILEQEVYPFLTGELELNSNEILKFHKGNKKGNKGYAQPEGSELEFRSLNQPSSNKKYILLVQVGKEGWDCPTLSAVILSQKGDSPQNMVLQTSCRCLRQVDKNQNETAIIWLNKDNADTLNKQLKQEQNLSIEELNKASQSKTDNLVPRTSRMDILGLPKIDFYQMKVSYKSIDEEDNENTAQKLLDLKNNIDLLTVDAIITTTDIVNLDNGKTSIVSQVGNKFASYNQWLFDISRESFALISTDQLFQFDAGLRPIFEKITYQKNGVRYFNELYDLHSIQSKIRLAFSIKRNLQTTTEEVPQQAELLIAHKLAAVEDNPNLRPNKEYCEKVLEIDKTNANIELDEDQIMQAYEAMKAALEAQGMAKFIQPYESFKLPMEQPETIKAKNITYHYLPYNFGGSGSSGLELAIFEEAIKLDEFKNKQLEIYYNGERGLTEFVIDCYAKKGNYWKNIGKYTTDFLIVKRQADKTIKKILMVETKGTLYANDDKFKNKRTYVENDFLQLNKSKFGYQRFDFIYLEDSQDINTNKVKLSHKIAQFFSE